MTDRTTPQIKALARRCAHGGLTLAQARLVFETLAIADALVLESGHVSRAAERLGINRVTLSRRIHTRTQKDTRHEDL
ncbi:helix-turn-helix domain-containing protein [Sagittula sp.]|uniref:helix-turn-helix domain-containing protein n=1 Tax=Sagittula sp. TaxID=2038081 RepID=UPI003517194F